MIWGIVVLLCAGIAKGIEGESLKLRDRGLCKDNCHKPGTLLYISSVIRFIFRKRSCFGILLIYLRSRKSLREVIPVGDKYPTTTIMYLQLIRRSICLYMYIYTYIYSKSSSVSSSASTCHTLVVMVKEVMRSNSFRSLGVRHTCCISCI